MIEEYVNNIIIWKDIEHKNLFKFIVLETVKKFNMKDKDKTNLKTGTRCIIISYILIKRYLKQKGTP